MKRPIRIEGELAYVDLTQGHVAVIDASDVPLVEGMTWGARVYKHGIYAATNVVAGDARATLYLHRLLMAPPSGMFVDHADGNGLNNRRSNLRLATPQQNQHNRKIDRRSTSGFKGVSFHRARGKWMAGIRLNGRNRYLGLFMTAAEAHAAYVAASQSLHGEYGRAG